MVEGVAEALEAGGVHRRGAVHEDGLAQQLGLHGVVGVEQLLAVVPAHGNGRQGDGDHSGDEQEAEDDRKAAVLAT